MSLGTVLHAVSSDAGSISFRASEEWEATEVAPGGCDGGKEVISETWADRYAHIFVRGAQWKTWHEQTGNCIWGGTIRDTPTQNDGRAEISLQGHAQKAERKTGRLLYQSQELEDFVPHDRQSGNSKYRDAFVDSEGYLFVRRASQNDTTRGAIGTANWLTDNYDTGVNIVFETPGFDGLSRFACEVAEYAGSASMATVFKVLDYDLNFIDGWVIAASGSQSVDVDLQSQGVWLQVEDLSSTDADLIAKYGAWPAFRPGGTTNDYDTWTRAVALGLTDVRVNGIAPGDTYSVSSVAKDLCQRLRVKPTDIDEFGFNALPLDFKDGESFAEAFDYISLLANARWLLLDNGHKPYLDFGKFSKRVWETWDPHTPIDLLPLERFDRVTIPYKQRNTKKKEWVTVIADDPFTEPNTYGRLRMKDPKADSTQAQELGERLLPALYEQRWGGSAQLATVGLEGGDRQSAYFLHAGDILRVPQRRARARVARKSMTIRGVTVEFESNYAPLDSYLARRAKRLQAA